MVPGHAPAETGAHLRCGALSNGNAKQDFAAIKCPNMPGFIGEDLIPPKCIPGKSMLRFAH
jgi:hypothetical protein